MVPGTLLQKLRCPVIDRETRQLILSKPERIAGFDRELVTKLRGEAAGGTVALVEIAGRDSVAAGIKAASSGSYDFLVPTIVYTGTEYGDWSEVLANARALADRFPEGEGPKVLETVLLGSPSWWHAVAAGFSSVLFKLYGFSTACVACHMYLHAARVPFARETGAGAIVSGERLSHDGRLKLNQLEPALRAYGEVIADNGIELALPLADVKEGRHVEEVLGESWKESARQLGCVLEGNYRDLDGNIIACDDDLVNYIDGFLVPFTDEVLSSFAAGSTPDYTAMVKKVISGIIERRGN